MFRLPLSTTATLVWALFLLPGCESVRYSSARSKDSLAAYQAYLAQHPKGAHASAARGRLEELRYRQAKLADRPLGYRAFLHQHPDGRHAAACRERLAKLALSSAKTPAALELVIERYPGTKQATSARERLPAVVAAAALKSDSLGPSQAFLDRFPASAGARAIRSHLAQLVYRNLPDLQVDLESFVQRFRGTPSGRKALKRLEVLLETELRRNPTKDLLRQFESRFPKNDRRAALEALVNRGRWDRGLAGLDLPALQASVKRGGEVPKSVGGLVRWCERGPKACAALRRLAEKARPWRPSVPFEKLKQQSYAPDMQVAWKAIAALSLSEGPRIGDHLAELLGSPRLSVVWSVAGALDRWLGRLGGRARATWLARRSRRPFRAANPDEVQRAAYIALISGGQGDGRQRLIALMTDQGRPLTAAYLLVRWEQVKGAPSGKALSRLLAAARSRIKWLKDAYPAELHKESLVAGVLAERELFAISSALEETRARVGTRGRFASLADLINNAAATLAAWRLQLARTSKTFRPAKHIDLAPEVARHDRARGEALRALARHKHVGRIVAGAICRTSRFSACASIMGTQGGDKTRER
jgi:hypothetical protein